MKKLLIQIFSSLRHGFRVQPVAWWESLIMRAGVGWFYWQSLLSALPFDSMDRPVGLARVMDLNWLGDERILRAIEWGGLVAALLYVAGVGLPVVLVLMTLSHLLEFTYYNSQGFTSHGNQIITLILIAQTLVVLGHWAFCKSERPARLIRFPWARGCERRDGWWVQGTVVVIAGVYVTSAVTKMWASGGLWFHHLPDIALQLVKTHQQHFHNDPAAFGGVPPVVPIADWVAANPNLTRLFFGGGWFLEAFAFLALANRGWAFLIGVSLIIMHRMIFLTMELAFELNEWMEFFFLVNLPFWLVLGWQRWQRGKSPPSASGV